ncbi:MAG TPA: hypothetical protein VG797_03240 [Phycisphaerales bacterium]|nr:hypothetical protein [Phycisphaerales bacterium]
MSTPAPGRSSSLARRTAWLAVAALALVFLAVSLTQISAADIWWQLATGRYVLEHGFPRVDVFSSTATGHEWIEMRWLFCVVIYLLWQLGGGGALLIILQSALLATVLILLFARSRPSLLTLPGLITAALGLGTFYIRFSIRPELVSYLFSALFLFILDGATRPGGTTRSRKALWALPFLQIIWVNAHTVFIFGPILAWAFAGGDTLHRLARRRGLLTHTAGSHKPQALIDAPLICTALAVTLACLVNPYFIKGALFPFLLFTETMSREVSTVITELNSTLSWPGWPPDKIISLLFVAWSAIVLVAGTFRLNLTRLGLWLAFAYLFYIAIRNSGPFSIIAMWTTIRTIDDLRATGFRGSVRMPVSSEHCLPPRSQFFSRLAPIMNLALAILFFFTAWFAATNRYANTYLMPRRLGLGVLPMAVPAEAAAFLRAHKPLGPIYNSMDAGSYLAFAAPDLYKVWVDGRIEVYGSKLLLDLVLPPENWDKYADAHGLNTILLQTEVQSTVVLPIFENPKWALVHLDAMWMIFVRRIPEHQALIAQYAIDPLEPWTPRTPEPDQQPPRWARALGAVGFCWHDFGLATTFLNLGAVENARRSLEHAVQEFPDHSPVTLLLAQVERALGHDSRAAELERPFHLSASEREWARGTVEDIRTMLAFRARQSQASTAAASDTELAAKADAAFAQGAYSAALILYTDLVRTRQRDPAVWTRLAECYEHLNRTGDAQAARRMVEKLSSPNSQPPSGAPTTPAPK